VHKKQGTVAMMKQNIFINTLAKAVVEKRTRTAHIPDRQGHDRQIDNAVSEGLCSSVVSLQQVCDMSELDPHFKKICLCRRLRDSEEDASSAPRCF
jgi:hypothetical protein